MHGMQVWYCPVVGFSDAVESGGWWCNISTVALAWGVSRIPLSKFEHMLGTETKKLTLITDRMWQMVSPAMCLNSGLGWVG